MAHGPLGAWRAADALSVAPRSPGALDGSSLQAYVELYAAAAQIGISPLDVDAMEVWQIASALGIGIAERPTGDDSGRVPSRKRDLIAERMAHASGNGPRPEPDAPSVDALAMMQQLSR
jgi:hypothetical protein